MRKTRIEVKTAITACANTHEAAQLAINNWRNKNINMANSNKKVGIDPINVELAEFSVHIKTSLADSICKTCHKWAIDNFPNCSNNNLITSLIMNIRAKSATHMEKFLTICCCQVDELHCPDIGDIDYISEDLISS